MAEIYGKKTGLCGGYGGSMHLVDVDRGFLGTSGIVAQGIPQATGAAWAAQIRKAGPGRPVLLRRRRVEAGRVPRVAEHRVAVEAADRLRDGEQRLQRPHAQRAGGRQRGRRRAAGGQGDGLQHARRHRRRRRPGRGARDGRGGGRAGARRRGADARRVARLPPQRARQHHRPAGRPAALPRARGDREVRGARGVRGGAARRPGPALPRPARRGRHADAPRTPTGSPTRSRDEMQAAVDFGIESPFPDPERALDHVYA